jgi:glycosyltransferase involved in cell wall biosynthesis
MKILHVIDQISQRTSGGSGKVAYELAEIQAELGHQVSIYTTDYNAKNQRPPQGVAMTKFKTRANLFGALRVAPGLLTASYNYDIMHLHNYRTIVNLMAAMRPIPFVLQAHGSCLPIKGRTKPLHDFVWGRGILKRARRCIADADREVTQYLTEGADADNIRHIPIGIDLKQFKELPKRFEVSPETSKKVLFIGRFDNFKGLDLLITAFQYIEVPNITLEIAGVDYGEKAELRNLIKKLQLRKLGREIHWLGPLYGSKKINALTQAAVLVMPSRYEMWGLTFMEALACGTPVIMTDTCEASKVLPLECGKVVPFEPKRLATAIKSMIDIDYADCHRSYRQQWVSQYSWDNIVGRILDLYAEVLNEW